jgi:hypothetical protein
MVVPDLDTIVNPISLQTDDLSIMDDETIRRAFEAYGVTTEITCPQAFEISERYNIPKMDIARYCNQHEPRIKIRGCQLGCFR